jgi:hypothetical protein
MTKTYHKIIIHLNFYLNDEKQDTFSLLWFFLNLRCKSRFQVCNICFKYVSSISYQRESMIYLFSFLWIYNDLYVITSHKSISLNFLMKNTSKHHIASQIQKYLFLTLIIPKNFKFCIQLDTNQMESIMVSKWNLSKNWIYFLVFSWKTVFF